MPTLIIWDFQGCSFCIALVPNQPNRRVRTRTHGGVTGTAGDRLPMSMPGRQAGIEGREILSAESAALQMHAKIEFLIWEI